MSRVRYFTLGGVLTLCALPFLACGSPESEPENESDDEEVSASGGGLQRREFVETSGGTDLPPLESTKGSLSVVGVSDAVPVSNQSFVGFRDPEGDGEELVRCNQYPDGTAEYPRPYLEILSGFQGRLYYQVQAQLFEFVQGSEVEVPLGVEDSLEEGTQGMIFIASLTHDAEEGAYRYWYSVDEYAYPPYGSSCSVHVRSLSDTWLEGSITCENLIAAPESPDAPVTNAPYPTAQISIDFDCPLELRDPRRAAFPLEVEGTCTGTPDPCFFRDTFDCLDAPGCSVSGTCSGSAQACSIYPEFYSCENQDGCYWSGFECYGFADSCYTFDSDELACLLQSGCNFNEECDGQAAPCFDFATEDSCEAQGCTWESL